MIRLAYIDVLKGIRNHIIGHRQDVKKVAEDTLGKPLSQSESSIFWIKRAINEAKQNPSQYIKAQTQKMAAFVAPHSVGTPENFLIDRQMKPWLYFTFINFSMLLVLAIVSMPLFLKSPIRNLEQTSRLFTFQFLCILGYTASIFITFIIERYRFPVYALLTPLAAFVLKELVTLVYSRKYRLVAGYSISIVCIYMLFLLAQNFYQNKFFKIHDIETYVVNMKQKELKNHLLKFKLDDGLSSKKCERLVTKLNERNFLKDREILNDFCGRIH